MDKVTNFRIVWKKGFWACPWGTTLTILITVWRSTRCEQCLFLGLGSWSLGNGDRKLSSSELAHAHLLCMDCGNSVMGCFKLLLLWVTCYGDCTFNCELSSFSLSCGVRWFHGSNRKRVPVCFAFAFSLGDTRSLHCLQGPIFSLPLHLLLLGLPWKVFFPLIFHFMLLPLFKILFSYFRLLIYFTQLCFLPSSDTVHILNFLSYLFPLLKALSYKLSKSLALGALL